MPSGKLVRPLIPKPKPGGRPQSVDWREILNAVFYLVRGGIQWRMLPHDFPPWGTVHYYYRQWRRDGTWEAIQNALRTKVGHKAAARGPIRRHHRQPNRETTEMGGPRGYDAGKRIKGRKRHILVDTLGLLLCSWSTPQAFRTLPARSSCWPRSWAGSRGCG